MNAAGFFNRPLLIIYPFPEKCNNLYGAADAPALRCSGIMFSVCLEAQYRNEAVAE